MFFGKIFYRDPPLFLSRSHSEFPVVQLLKQSSCKTPDSGFRLDRVRRVGLGCPDVSVPYSSTDFTLGFKQAYLYVQ